MKFYFDYLVWENAPSTSSLSEVISTFFHLAFLGLLFSGIANVMMGIADEEVFRALLGVFEFVCIVILEIVKKGPVEDWLYQQAVKEARNRREQDL